MVHPEVKKRKLTDHTKYLYEEWLINTVIFILMLLLVLSVK